MLGLTSILNNRSIKGCHGIFGHAKGKSRWEKMSNSAGNLKHEKCFKHTYMLSFPFFNLKLNG